MISLNIFKNRTKDLGAFVKCHYCSGDARLSADRINHVLFACEKCKPKLESKKISLTKIGAYSF